MRPRALGELIGRGVRTDLSPWLNTDRAIAIRISVPDMTGGNALALATGGAVPASSASPASAPSATSGRSSVRTSTSSATLGTSLIATRQKRTRPYFEP